MDNCTESAASSAPVGIKPVISARLAMAPITVYRTWMLLVTIADRVGNPIHTTAKQLAEIRVDGIPRISRISVGTALRVLADMEMIQIEGFAGAKRITVITHA